MLKVLTKNYQARNFNSKVQSQNQVNASKSLHYGSNRFGLENNARNGACESSANGVRRFHWQLKDDNLWQKTTKSKPGRVAASCELRASSCSLGKLLGSCRNVQAIRVNGEANVKHIPGVMYSKTEQSNSRELGSRESRACAGTDELLPGSGERHLQCNTNNLQNDGNEL